MPFSNCYVTEEPTRDEIDALTSPTLLEFSTDRCVHSQEAQPFIAAACTNYPQISHIKVLDGRGRLLGRSFGVKVWPTLVFLKCGKEVTRLIRPENAAQIGAAMKQIG